MLGALIGDIVGHPFEFKFKKDYDFPLFSKYSNTTDDSYMTLAVAMALYTCRDNFFDLERLKKEAILEMKTISKPYKDSHIWGENFWHWLFKGYSLYDSCGNGAAMRISPVGWVADSEEEVKVLSKALTEISHNHPEALKGAEALAMAVYLARIGRSKEEIRGYIATKYYPKVLKAKYRDIQPYCEPDPVGDYITCQGSVPEAIIAFLDSTSYEDAIRKAIAYGMDTDTQACMAGAIAEAYYGIPIEIEDQGLDCIPDDLIGIYYSFNQIKKPRVLR